jgi:hypothetical protein
MCMGDNIVINRSSPLNISGDTIAVVPNTYAGAGGPTATPQIAVFHIVDDTGRGELLRRFRAFIAYPRAERVRDFAADADLFHRRGSS